MGASAQYDHCHDYVNDSIKVVNNFLVTASAATAANSLNLSSVEITNREAVMKMRLE